MSDTSKFTFTNKRRIHEIDDMLENLSRSVNNLSGVVFKSDFECSIMTAKLKREKVRALTAVAKSQVILAEMEIVIAESELISDLERLKNVKKTKLESVVDNFHHSTPITSIHNSPQDAAVPMTNSSSQVKSSQAKKKKSSSKKHNTDLADTVLVAAIEQGESRPITENSQLTSQVNSQLVKVASDSEMSITSSLNAEFNRSYSRSNTPHIKNKSNVNKADSKTSSKGKSTVRKNYSLSISVKNEAEANKNLLHKQPRDSQLSTPTQKLREPKFDTKTIVSTCTYVPGRHNLPVIISQANMKNLYDPRFSSTSVMSPCLYVNTAMPQANIHQTPTKNNSQSFSYYGSK